MNQLDNSEDQPARLLKNARKIGGFLLLGALLLPGISCRKAVPAPAETAAMHPAAEAVAQAEQLFAGRQDLVKVRQAVVVLRLAQAEDQGNYELAWRLAKFNYYLGDHSPDTAERDKAFHDGVEAGQLAVKLQDGKPDGHFWLGAKYGPVRSGGDYGIPDVHRMADLSASDQSDREALRRFLAKKYENERKSAAAGSQKRN